MVALDGIDLPPLLGGRYRPVRFLGAGAMGRVLEVVHEHTGEHLALKILSSLAHDEAAALRFEREARAFTAIGGDRVARVLDAGTLPELGDAPFLAMELLDGEDLGQRLAREGPQEPADIVRWTHDIAAALERAHRAGIVHRDLKPSNVFLIRGEEGETRVKVIDFGVAKVADLTSHTADGSLIGTPRWSAPEQVQSSRTVGPPADQWSLAMVVFACLAGRSYLDGGTVSQVLSQILFSELPPPSQRGSRAGPGFDAWFLRSCARDPVARWPSARAQAQALEDALRGAIRQHAPPPPADEPTQTEAPLALGAPAGARPVAAPSAPSHRATSAADGPALAERSSSGAAPTARRRPHHFIVATALVALVAGGAALGILSSPGDAPPRVVPPEPSARVDEGIASTASSSTSEVPGEPSPVVAAASSTPSPATPRGDSTVPSGSVSATLPTPKRRQTVPTVKPPTRALDPFGTQK